MKLCFPESVLNQLSAPSCTSCCAPIVGLLLLCCPMAVAWFVVPVVVFAIYRMKVARTFSHIGEKDFKAVTPAITYGNATATIFGVRLRSLVVAPVLHLLPGAILRAIRHVMSAIRQRSALSLKTSTGMNLLSEMILPYYGRVAAVAFALPETMSGVPLGFFHNQESAKPLASQIGISLSHNTNNFNWWGE